MVEPRDVGDDPRIVELSAEGRHQHRWVTVNRWACRSPDTLAGQRMREDRLDPGRPRTGVSRPLRGLRAPDRHLRHPHGWQGPQLRPTLLRPIQRVVDVLDVVDDPVAEWRLVS